MIVYRVYNKQGGFVEYGEEPQNEDYEVIDKTPTQEEIQAYKDDLAVENIQLRKALIHIGIMPSSITAMLYNLPQDTPENIKRRELLINMWEYENTMRRSSPDIISFGAEFNLGEKQLDELFVLAGNL